MATKTPAVRVTDTLYFLQNTLLAPAAQADAYQLALDFVQGRFPGGAASATYQAFSQELSLGWHLASDPNQHRHMTRALFMLWKAMRWRDGTFPMPAAQISQISQANAGRLLASYMRKARCLIAPAQGAAEALAQFQLQPLDFLRDNKVMVRGSPAIGAGPTNVQAFAFFYEPGRDRYVFSSAGLAPATAHPLQVESVTAFHWADARYLGAAPMGGHAIATANFGNMQGIRLSGANVMVTTQFTGCSFCMASHGGHAYGAHVSPHVATIANSTTGRILANRIIATGAFGNAGATAPQVYGSGVGSAPHGSGYTIGDAGGNTTYMTIVGFPGGANHYRIYSQTTQNDRIQREPVQIF